MVVAQGDILWAALPDPTGSGPGFRRPVLVVQSDALNASRIATVVVVPFSSNRRLTAAPGNIVFEAEETGLPRDSVANVPQIVAIERELLAERAGGITRDKLDLVFRGLDLILGRA